jgi:glutamate decarboxylase
MRVVVRESMSMDLLSRLITDILDTTENIIKMDEIDLSAWNPFSQSVEKEHASAGITATEKHGGKADEPMQQGVHRSVC